MLLEEYLRDEKVDLDKIIKQNNLNKYELSTWKVIQYPDELIYALSRKLKKKPSLLLFELLHLENPGQVRRTATDYSLLKALENEVLYIFLPKAYRKEQTKFLTDILIDKNIFELEFHPLARFNIFGREIYKLFLSSTDKSKEFLRIEDILARYFVLVHDNSGTILCHSTFNKERNLL